MLSATGNVTGIDLGSSSVKLVRARGGRTAARLVDVRIEELPTTDQETWESESSKAIGRILKSAGLRKRDLGHVLVAVTGGSVHVRQVDLPVLSEAEIRSSMKYEARKHLPLENPAEAAVDCQVLTRQEAAQKMSVLFAGAPDGLVKSRVRVLQRAGIEPEVVDAAPLSLLNGLYAQPAFKEGAATIAVLDLGTSGTTVVMSRKGGTVYSRTLARNASPVDTPQGLEEYARSIAAVFRETAQFYGTMNARRQIEAVFLAGGNALVPGIDAKLAELLGIHVSPLDLTTALHYSPAGTGDPSVDEVRQSAPRFAVALGLLFWGNGNVSN